MLLILGGMEVFMSTADTNSQKNLLNGGPGNRKEKINESIDVNEASNIDRVRDILFGSQVREIEKKFIHLKEDIDKRVEDLRDETSKHFDSLENYFKKELLALNELLKTQQDLLNKTARELRQDILDQSKKLSDEILIKNKEILAVLEKRTTELREDKADRSSLSKLLTEMAIQLSDDLANKIGQDTRNSSNE